MWHVCFGIISYEFHIEKVRESKVDIIIEYLKYTID